MNASDILNKAADLIEEYGWVQNQFGAEYIGYCAVGAVYEAGQNDGVPQVGEALTRLRKTVHAGDGWIYISRWNDEEGRTKEEVIAKLREAANS